MPLVGGTPLPLPNTVGIGETSGVTPAAPVSGLVVPKLKLHRLSATLACMYAFAYVTATAGTACESHIGACSVSESVW